MRYFILSVLSIALLAGCAIAYGPAGISAPITIMKTPGQVGPAESSASTSKIGKACASGLLGTAHGDASLSKAMLNGGITQVETVDYDILNFVVYTRLCTIVKGQ